MKKLCSAIMKKLLLTPLLLPAHYPPTSNPVGTTICVFCVHILFIGAGILSNIRICYSYSFKVFIYCQNLSFHFKNLLCFVFLVLWLHSALLLILCNKSSRHICLWVSSIPRSHLLRNQKFLFIIYSSNI